jgi:hypothetical protein
MAPKASALRTARSSVRRLPARRRRRGAARRRRPSRRRQAAAGRDAVGDQQALALGARREQLGERVHVHAVADQVAAQAVVRERRAGEPGRAMVDPAHRVPVVRHVTRAARDGRRHLVGVGLRVAERGHHAPAAEQR